MDNEVEVTVCDICGDAGRKRDSFLAICCKCPNGAEHTYCMREMREKLPEGDWMCEECTMRSECQEFGRPVNLNSLERKTKEKGKAPHSRGGKRRAGKLAVEIDGKRRAVKTRTISLNASKPSDRALQTMDRSLKKLGKEKVEASLPLCSVRQSSHGSRETPKLLARLGKESKKFDSQTEIAPHDKCALLKSGIGSCKSADEKFKGQLTVGGCFPRPDYIWLGKFQIHISEGIELICDGIRAHLSTHAWQKASEVINKLPDVIVLEELPRLRMWPAQFMESGATENNIALYFYAKDLKSHGTYYKGLIECMTKKDLALKGNVNGFELLIFPSNILPEKSQRWNDLLFLWGVFRGRKINNSANTPLSESQKRENRDIVRIRDFDLNAYPKDEDEDENDMAGVHEIGESDCINIGSSRDRFFRGAATYNSGQSDSVKPLVAEERMPKPVPESGLSLRSESAIGNVSDKSNKDVKGKTPKQENYDAEDVELLHWGAVVTLYLLSMGRTKI